MADNNQMIKKPEMGFFQRIRKNMLMRNINQAKYAKAPLALRNDMDVVGALLNADPNSAETLNTDLVMSVVGQENGLFQKLSEVTQKTIVDSRPEYLAQMPNDQARAYVDKKGPDYIKYLSEQLQQNMLTEKIQADSYGIDLGSFSPSVVQRVVADFSNAAKEDGASQTSKDKYEDLLKNGRGVISLPPETQMQLASIDPRFIDKVSDEIAVELISQNPYLISYRKVDVRQLPTDIQVKVAGIDGEYLTGLSRETLEAYVGNNPFILKQCNKEFQVEFVKKHPEYFDILDGVQKRDILQIPIDQVSYATNSQFQGAISADQIFGDVDMLKRNVVEAVPDLRTASDVRAEYIKGIDDIVEITRFEPAFMGSAVHGRIIDNETRLNHNLKINEVIKRLTEEVKAEFSRYSANFQYGEERQDVEQEMSVDELTTKIETLYSQLVSEEVPDVSRITRCSNQLRAYIQEMAEVVQKTNQRFDEVRERENLYRGVCPTLNEKQRANLYGMVEETTNASYNEVDERTAEFGRNLIAEWDRFEQTKEVTQPVMDIYRQVIDDPQIIEALEGLEPTKLVTKNLPKVLFNPKVMASVQREKIIEYINNPQIDTLREMVITSYGEQTRQIFEDRPELSVDQIGNLDIFDSKIVDKFGVGTVHAALTYTADTNLAAMLGDLARNPEAMQQYEMYEAMVGDYFGDTALEMDSKMKSFYGVKHLVAQMSLEDLTDERRKNILSAINDMNRVDETNETRVISLQTLEDLDNYTQRRNAMYDEYVQRAGNSEGAVKEAIARRFFGMSYAMPSKFTPRHTSLAGMRKWYNLETFTQDDRTKESGEFTQDELDQLQLVSVIRKIENPEVLKQVYQTLAERENVLTPVDFKRTSEKIPLLYAKECVESLLTVDDAIERAQAGEEGISYEQTEDGFGVIKLNGADFRIYSHTTGYDNSEIYASSPEKRWMTFENGCSTISGCLLEPSKLKGAGVENAKGSHIEIGIAGIPPEQLIGMGISDVHVSHDRRKLNPEMVPEYLSFDYPELHTQKTQERINRGEDAGHSYDEAVLLRNQAKLSEIKEGTYGGRIATSYIIARGEITDKHREMAKAMGTNTIVLIDENAYEEIARQQEVQEMAIDEKTQETVTLGQKDQEVKIQPRKVAPKAKNDDFEI